MSDSNDLDLTEGVNAADSELTAPAEMNGPDAEQALDGESESSTLDVADEQDGPEDSDEADTEAAAATPGRTRTAPSKALLEREGEIAADFLETLLDICDLDGDLDVDIEGDRASVSIVDSEEGRVPRRLVGQDAKVLDALQELTRLAVYTKTGERSRLILDIAGHRSTRRTALMAIADEAIAAVKTSGEQRALEPMSAYERKLVHDQVLAAGLRSESDGVEPRRYVVVHPA